MPTIIVNKKRLLEHLWKNMGDDELKEKICMLGTSLEGMKDNEIEVEVFPNRPDYLSEHMFAKALSSFMGINTKYEEYKSHKLPDKYKVIVDQSVKQIRPYTVCAIVRGLSFDDDRIKEIIQTQEKLHVTFCRNRKKAAIGIYPADKIEFPVTFRADSPKKIRFLPLEADREMDGDEILAEHPTGKDYAHLLEGLDKYPYFVDSKGSILSMPPIINSEKTGRVTDKTKDVFIECSGFDLFTLNKILNIIVCSFAEMGGEICEVPVEYDHKYTESELMVPGIPGISGETTKKRMRKDAKDIKAEKAHGSHILRTPMLSPQTVDIDVDYVNRKLGLELTKSDVMNCLQKMGIGYDRDEDKALVPPYRADVLHPIDLVEDIAIAYGFFEFTPEIPHVATTGKEDALEIFKKKMRDILIGFELIEVKNYNITSYEGQTKMLQQENDYAKDVVVLQNSLTIEFDSLRKSILSSAMMTLKNNKTSEYPQNFFEIGECFSSDTSHKKMMQNLLHDKLIANDLRFDSKCYDFPKLGVTLCSKETDFTRIKQVLQGIFECLDMPYDLERSSEINSRSYIPGRAGDISVKGEYVGTLGEIHPQVLKNFELEFPVSYLELDLAALYHVFRKK